MALINIKWVEDDRNKKILFESRGSSKKETKRKGLVLDWIKRYKWSSNPFVDEIIEPISEYTVGYEHEKKKINLFFVQNSRFGMIKGSSGSGKTTLLKWLNSELGTYGDKYSIYMVSAKETKKGFINHLTKPFSSFSILNKEYTPSEAVSIISKHSESGKNIVFLIDDAHFLDSISHTFLKELISTTKNVTLISTISTDVKQSEKEHMKDELGIDLKEMPFDSVHEMIKKRIERVEGIDIDPFTVVQLRTLTKKAAGNPREILSLCSKKAAEFALMGKDPDAKDADLDKDELKELEAELAVYNKNSEETETPSSRQKSEHSGSSVYEGDKIVQEVLSELNEDKKDKNQPEESDEKEDDSAEEKDKKKKSSKSKKK
jgi:type II secretory pathway predicted ATPase ExeA